METKLHDAVYWTLSCAKHRKEIEIEGGRGNIPSVTLQVWLLQDTD